jgi:hypothetical protein
MSLDHVLEREYGIDTRPYSFLLDEGDKGSPSSLVQTLFHSPIWKLITP